MVINFLQNKSNQYTETERCIGRWIDGKPLYRRVFTTTNLGNGSATVSFFYSDLNINNLVKTDAIMRRITDDNLNIKLPYLINGATPIVYDAEVSGGNLTFTIRRQNREQFDDRYIQFIIEYTKTTDTVNTPIT